MNAINERRFSFNHQYYQNKTISFTAFLYYKIMAAVENLDLKSFDDNSEINRKYKRLRKRNSFGKYSPNSNLKIEARLLWHPWKNWQYDLFKHRGKDRFTNKYKWENSEKGY